MKERRLVGIALKIGPLGEYDRLLTLLSDSEGIVRLALPGARRPKSKLSSATQLTLLELQIGRSKGLGRVQQLKVKRSFSTISNTIATLAAAQALCELSIQLASNYSVDGLFEMLLMHIKRLEQQTFDIDIVLAKAIQACIHLLTLGGYSLPLQSCCLTGVPLEPPIGIWEWRCSLLPEDGFAINAQPNAAMMLNPSELALLQRLCSANLPQKKNGDLMGPRHVWIRLLSVVEIWIRTHLQHRSSALEILRESLNSYN